MTMIWLSPAAGLAADDYAAWTNVTDLTLNTSAAGANIPGTLTAFPLLVRLSANNFDFAQAQADGRDIRFAKTNGVHLAYEIERWDAAKQQAEIWVKLDSIKGNSAAQSIRMYWGNAAAVDSSNAAAVYATNYVAVWHLNGTGTAARPNAVAGGNPAATVNYDGDESASGVIAGADSLDGAVAGDYLDVGDGYADWSGGLTYSVWVYPTAVKQWAHVLDFGNGEGIDNFILNRVDTTNNMGFHNWAGTANSTLAVNNQWALNQWQLLAVTVTGKYVRLYKNGALVMYDSLTNTMPNIARTMCFLGRSNWARDQYYQGKLDQPELSKVQHSDNWIRLVYLNQKPGQSIPVVVKPNNCAMKFAAPADTSIAEGAQISLNATVDCASSFAWSVVSGPGGKILDPEQKNLLVMAPRVPADTDMVFRISATYSDSTRNRDVRVHIREAIPDPAFTMPANASWNGKDSLPYRPAISNLAAIRASRDSVLHWAWGFSGTTVDTAWLDDGVMLRSAGQGDLAIHLCLDNGGGRICHDGALSVSTATGLAIPLARPVNPARPAGRDALGRDTQRPAPLSIFRR